MNELTKNLRSILEAHFGTTYTAAVVQVVGRGRVVANIALGTLNPERGDEPVTTSTPFDLASLTKLFTSTAVLRLIAGGRLELEDPVQKYLPAFNGPGKNRVTIRHLLTHSSGLPPMVTLFGADAPSGDPWNTVFKCPLEAPPGSRVVYSDVGFMVLARLIEDVSGNSLPVAMRSLVLDPLDLPQIGFGPCPDAPATEFDPWRGRRLQGEVHDENAAALGGASGHAGLFGPAGAVVALARAFAKPDGHFLPSELISQAVREQAQSDDERRGLGWKLWTPYPDASGVDLSTSAFGHTGFTGTSVWTDPKRDVTVTLLTNRVYFGRDPDPIIELRRQVVKCVAASFPRPEAGR